MEKLTVIRENWLTKNPSPLAMITTLSLMWLMLLATYVSVHEVRNFREILQATGQSVFVDHEYWKLWTSLFVHGDLGHLLSNCLVFFPFSYFLAGYFGPIFFPFAALAVGGLTNWIVLKNMPLEVALVGFSGVVHWMGAAWLTLYLLIERRESVRRRFAKFVMISVVLFAPEIYKPEVSYLSHFVGFILGVVSASVYFAYKREEFRAAEVTETIIELDVERAESPRLLVEL